jgi:hypothetical protein
MQQRSTRPEVKDIDCSPVDQWSLVQLCDRRQIPNSRHSPAVTDQPWEPVFPEACHNLASLDESTIQTAACRQPGARLFPGYQPSSFHQLI